MIKTIIAVLIIGAIAVGGYSVSKRKANIPVPQVEDQQQAAPTAGKKMPFASFIKNGGSYQCTVHQYMSDIDNSGTVYVSDGKMRGEFSTIAEGRTVNSSIIVRDGFTYMWNNFMSQGFKVAVPETFAGASFESSGTYMWNAEQIGEYDCQPWTTDETKFSLPGNITFQALTR